MKSQLPEMYSLIVKGFPLRIAEGEVMRVRTPEDAYRLTEDITVLPNEVFVVIALNSKNYVIDKILVTQGLLDTALVHPREVYRSALIQGAAAVVLCHNHPSNDTTPSAEDLRITKQLVEAGKIIDIKVLDHVVVGKRTDSSKGFTSMREAGLCEF